MRRTDPLPAAVQGAWSTRASRRLLQIVENRYCRGNRYLARLYRCRHSHRWCTYGGGHQPVRLRLWLYFSNHDDLQQSLDFHAHRTGDRLRTQLRVVRGGNECIAPRLLIFSERKAELTELRRSRG